MVGEFEAIGDAVTGGIIGRAVEPKAGEAAATTAIRTRPIASTAAPGSRAISATPAANTRTSTAR